MNPIEDQFFKDLDKLLWTAADKLRSNLDAAVYKHAVLGLIFLKYVSDAFKERRVELEAQFSDPIHEYFLGDDEIDARDLGYMKDRVSRDFTMQDISRIADTFHAWKRSSHLLSPPAEAHLSNAPPPPAGEARGDGEYRDSLGFCMAATLADIRKHDYILTPGRYAGAAQQEEDGEPFEEKIARLAAHLQGQFEESARLEEAIRRNLKGLGYEV
jgi:type I restriction-modification system DNA methylase subunit